MSEGSTTPCVLIPCSEHESWAVPHRCLAEIQVLKTCDETPPDEMVWRSHQIPVLDLGADGDVPWRQVRAGTGLIAVFLGVQSKGSPFWGVAVRGRGLALVDLSDEDITDAPDRVLDHASSAFTYNGVLYQVPDLDGLQQKIDSRRDAA